MSRGMVRVGGAAGIAGVVVALVGFPLQGDSPRASATAAVIGDYIAGHQSSYKLSGVLAVLAAALLSWFFATYGWLVHREDPDSPLGWVVLLSGSGFLGVLVLDGLMDVAMTFASMDPSAVHSPVMGDLYQLQDGVLMPGAFGFLAGVFLAAVAAAAFRGTVGAGWVGWLSALFAVLSVAGGVAGLWTVDGGTSSPFSFAPAFGPSVIVVVLGVVMLRWRETPVSLDASAMAASPA